MSMATNGSGTPPNVEDLEESRGEIIQKKGNEMAALRRELGEIFKKYEKRAKTRLGNLTREAHKAYEDGENDQSKDATAGIKKLMEEKVKEMKKLKEDVECCLEKVLEEPSESKAPTSEVDKTSESQEWKEKDKELENMLENAAKGDKGEDFEGLPETFRNCLLCPSIFPLGSEISKRVLIYWWIGQGFVTPSKDKTAEQVGEVRFQQFLDHEFIHPVYNKRSGNIVKCRIHPWIHWMLISKARKKEFFNFDETGTPILSPSKLHHACLITKSNDGQQEQKPYKPDEQLVLLFNVNVKYLDLDLESFSKMKNIVVLQLGRWQTSAEHHIEMDPQVLDKLSSLSNLKYLSLRGISVIETIPKSIRKLQYLQVLDLRGCQNLKNLTDGVTKLKRLTHLDVSECYMLECMPKGLSSLSELLVLKGFVMSERKKTGRLADLINLVKLERLSIIIGNQVKTNTNQFGELEKMKNLSSLTVIWSDLPENTPGYKAHQVDSLKFPPNLEKLDLRFYPINRMPKCLDPKDQDPSQLKNLKKLYIRGGKLETLGLKRSTEASHPEWKIETLRLKFLKNMKLEWEKIELPSLKYLEHYDSGIMDKPPLKDADGVWTSVKEEAPLPAAPSHDPDTAPSHGASSSGAPSLADEHTSGTPPVPSGSVPAPSTAPNATHDAETPPLMDADGVWTRVKEEAPLPAAPSHDPDTAPSHGASSSGAPSLADEHTSGTPPVPSGSVPAPSTAPNATHDASPVSSLTSSTNTSVPPAPSHDPNTAPSHGASSSGAPSLADEQTSGTPPVPSGSVPAPSTAPNATHDASPVSSLTSATNTSVPPANEADLKDDLKDESKHDPSSSASTAVHLTDLNTTSPDGVSISTSRATGPISGTPQVPSHSVPTLSAASDVTLDASVLPSPSSSTPIIVPPSKVDHEDDLEDKSEHGISSSASTAAHAIDPNTASSDDVTVSALGAASMAAEPSSGTPSVPGPTNAADVTRDSSRSSNPSSSTTTANQPSIFTTPSQVNSSLESPLPPVLFHSSDPIVTSNVVPDSANTLPAPADLPPLDPPSSLSN